jgi:GNAT superfamily N-acetyltransferase
MDKMTKRFPAAVLARILRFSEEMALNPIASPHHSAVEAKDSSDDNSDIADTEAYLEEEYGPKIGYVPDNMVSGLANVNFRSSVSFPTQVAFRRVTLSCFEGNNELGNVKGRMIHRDMIEPGEFHIVMDEESSDCSDLALTLFNHDGKVNRKWTVDEATKGSGVWTLRIGWGDFVVIETAEVAMTYRRKGMGRNMVQALLEEIKPWGVRHVYLWPTQLNSAPDAARTNGEEGEAKFAANKAKAIAFWRAMGFRRVGASHWFCYTMDPDHASHGLSAGDDLDPVGMKCSPRDRK